MAAILVIPSCIYPDNDAKTMKCRLLSLPTLEVSSAGENIANLVIATLEENNIPITNCLSLGSDNAAVMVGKKNGVIAKLRCHHEQIISIGCPCHLINLAAQHAARELPVSVDNLLIDVFYYLEGSVN